MADRRETASHLLKQIEEEINQTQRKLKELERERDAARVLAGVIPVQTTLSPVWPAEALGGVQLIRAKKMSDLVYGYLRHMAPAHGLTAVDLYNALKSTNAAIGRRNYIYPVLEQLQKEGRVVKATDGCYTAVPQ
jgi:hypothetical protein